MGKTFKDRRKQYTSDEDYEISVKKKQTQKFRKKRNKDLSDKITKTGIML